jgi:hypothetical protein
MVDDVVRADASHDAAMVRHLPLAAATTINHFR